MVVIAIIAILAAILFPVFAQAKAAAKQAATISNLKQNALAVLMYGADYDDMAFLPWQDGNWLHQGMGDPTGGAYAVQKLYPYTKNIDIPWDMASPIPNLGGRPTSGPGNGYWGDWTVSGTLAWSNNGLLYSGGPRSLAGQEAVAERMMMVSCSAPSTGGDAGCFAIDSTQASCYNTIPGGYNDPNWGPTRAALQWHANGYPSAFLDGHSKVKKGVDFYATDCDNQTFQWWANNSSAGNYTPNNAWSAFYLSDPIIKYWGTWWDPSK